MTSRVFGWLEIRNGVVLRLVETGIDGSSRSVYVMTINRPGDLGDIAAQSLTLSQGKRLVTLVQQGFEFGGIVDLLAGQGRADDRGSLRTNVHMLRVPMAVEDDIPRHSPARQPSFTPE